MLKVLLFVFWYCHKRGREERIKKESAAQLVDSEGRIIELDDDPMLEPNTTNTTSTIPPSTPSTAGGPTGTQVPVVAAATTTSSDGARTPSRSRQENLTPHDGSARDAARPSSKSSWRSGRKSREEK